MIAGGGETMLGMGDTPRTSSKPLPKLEKEGQPTPAVPGEQSIGNIPGGGETMLGMGDTPRTSSKPPAAKAPLLPPMDPNSTILPALDGGTTMLGMGDVGT